MAQIHVTGVAGQQYAQGDAGYDDANYQYATSSEGDLHDMHPGLIIQPNPADAIHDIVQTLKYAKGTKTAVAIRTGGHQYSGASSSGPANILLDLQHAFRDATDRQLLPLDQARKTHLRTSVSWSLNEFNSYLGSQTPGYFVPHGQCYYVNLGGHVQTGGYGPLGRSFGLLGDFVTELEIVNPEAPDFKKIINRVTDPKMFYAILGGSPGNFGVLTHFTIRLNCDDDYKGAQGRKIAWYYEPRKFEYLLGQLAKISDEGNLPRCYDICVNVVSKSWKGFFPWKELEDRLSDDYDRNPDLPQDDKIQFYCPLIAVFAQYVPFEGSPPFDKHVFDQFSSWFHGGIDLPLSNQKLDEPVSKIYRNWLTPVHREFDHPYVKRTYLTNSTSLSTNGWVTAVSEQVDKIIRSDNCYTSCQFQYFGGQHAQFRNNADNGTSYSWRDSTFCCTMDCFHEDSDAAREFARQWQRENDLIAHGDAQTPGLYSDQDRRVLWGSYSKEGEDWSLDATRDYYFEPGEHSERTKYKALQAARASADPDGIYTPNVFSVKRSESSA
ncbi:MAG: hypothetical protein M1828_005375 [Chrysothrix sp. TS-e1954]|nr:MAG: hypothetical protein M1828_005375 [Chrysothrix sp. TS-e1954]